MKSPNASSRSVIKIVGETLRQANKIRFPHCPPIYEDVPLKFYLADCEELREKLARIRDRASRAITIQFGEESTYVKEVNSFFTTQPKPLQLEAEHDAFVILLTNILDFLRLAVTSGDAVAYPTDHLPNALTSIHRNIKALLQRMDNALDQGDYALVLHTSACIFETMAKDIVDITNVQDKTLKSFFGRYRQDSRLPDEVLDYILAIYDSRSVSPLAGHGSTQAPNISRESAVILAEMTKAFVQIEYRLR